MTEHVLWSVPLPNAGAGLLLPRPGGGCLVFSSRLIAAFDQGGDQLWATAPTAPSLDLPVIGPQATVCRIEEDAIVVRDLASGTVVASHDAPLASGLCVAPWGDLLFSAAVPDSVARLHCLAPTGELRWSVLLDDYAPLPYPPTPMGQNVVVEQAGALSALDIEGQTAWTIPIPGARLSGAARRVSPAATVMELERDDGPVLCLLTIDPPSLTALADPSPVLAPSAVFRVDHQWVVAGQGPVARASPSERQYPLVALTLDPGGPVPRWEHPLPARPRAVVTAPEGGLVVTLSPRQKRWDDYHQYYDLSAETFVRMLDVAGSTRWSWYPRRPFTHFPIVDERGVVLLGADEHLWALTTT